MADTLDAMTSDRPYRRALTFAAAREEIIRESGKQFDPEVVSAFLAIDEGIWPELRIPEGELSRSLGIEQGHAADHPPKSTIYPAQATANLKLAISGSDGAGASAAEAYDANQKGSTPASFQEGKTADPDNRVYGYT